MAEMQMNSLHYCDNLRDKLKQRSVSLKAAAIWRMSVQIGIPGRIASEFLTNPLILKDSKTPEFLIPAHDDVANRAGRRACASRSIGWNWFMIF